MGYLPIYFDFLIAIAAIYRPAFFWFERHLGTLTALSAGSWEQPTFCLKIGLPVIVGGTVHLTCLPGLTAGRTTLGGMKMALGLIRQLFIYRKYESNATIKAVN
jgi:hypothetical protein